MFLKNLLAFNFLIKHRPKQKNCKSFWKFLIVNFLSMCLWDLREDLIFCVFWCRLPMHDQACAFSFSTKCFQLTQRTLWTSYFPFVLLQVLFKLQLSGACQVIEIEKVLCPLSMTQDDFHNMYIVAGWDFQQNVCGVGIHTALNLVAKEDFLAVLQKNKIAPRLNWWLSKSRGSILSSDQTILCSCGNCTMNTLARAYYCRSIPELMWGVSNNIEVFQSYTNT